jgi:two-component system, sensor histidine kinase RegB
VVTFHPLSFREERLMPLRAPALTATAPLGRTVTDPVGLTWLITVRWTTLLAGASAVLAGRGALEVSAPLPAVIALLTLCALSNVWLIWRVRSTGAATVSTAAGLLVCADVVVLSWLLWKSGGVLNPASVFYLVQIVVVALVLGRNWTWIVTALTVSGYAALFLGSTEALRAAQSMHPEIALHMRGMWMAFAFTALIIAVLVTRLVIAVERRDRALEALRERTTRATRVAGLATLAAGAAHELSTPLSTIAVAARELEHNLANRVAESDLREDARLIRAETDRCRQILDAMAGQSGEPVGETPRVSSIEDVVNAVRNRLNAAERDRLSVGVRPDLTVSWPVEVIARALCNLVRNGLQASTATGVRLQADSTSDGLVRLMVTDRGSGMSADHLSRAGEPFFTTKPPGAGTGLGLFVTRSSIEQLGGTLSLSSELGHGTTATITLPRDVVAPESHGHA